MSGYQSRGGGIVGLLGGMALGAAAMYYFDPDRGNGRRSVARGRARRQWRLAEGMLRKAAEYSRDRAGGMIAKARSRFSADRPSDDTLVARVRSRMGRVVSHPGAVTVRADEGTITLRGDVLVHELPSLLRAVWWVRGVREVRNELNAHEHADVPGLQGESRQRHLTPENWNPLMRVVGTTTGATLALWGLARGGILGVVGLLAGGTLLARATTNEPLEQLGARAVEAGEMAGSGV